MLTVHVLRSITLEQSLLLFTVTGQKFSSPRGSRKDAESFVTFVSSPTVDDVFSYQPMNSKKKSTWLDWLERAEEEKLLCRTCSRLIGNWRKKMSFIMWDVCFGENLLVLKSRMCTRVMHVVFDLISIGDTTHSVWKNANEMTTDDGNSISPAAAFSCLLVCLFMLPGLNRFHFYN